MNMELMEERRQTDKGFISLLQAVRVGRYWVLTTSTVQCSESLALSAIAMQSLWFRVIFFLQPKVVHVGIIWMFIGLVVGNFQDSSCYQLRCQQIQLIILLNLIVKVTLHFVESQRKLLHNYWEVPITASRGMVS